MAREDLSRLGFDEDYEAYGRQREQQSRGATGYVAGVGFPRPCRVCWLGTDGRWHRRSR